MGNTVGSQLRNANKNYVYAYIAGFLDGDGCITIKFEECKTTTLGYVAKVRVSFTQHKSKREILDFLCEYIGSGSVHEYQHNNMAEYVIHDQKCITEFLRNIEPYIFVKRRHLQLAKELILLKEKEHYTKESLVKMLDLRKKMASLNNYSKKFLSLTP